MLVVLLACFSVTSLFGQTISDQICGKSKENVKANAPGEVLFFTPAEFRADFFANDKSKTSFCTVLQHLGTSTNFAPPV